VTSDGVVFAIEARSARRVHLVGDFNGWRLEGSEMSLNGSVWTSLLRLQPGRYCYRYVIDGAWCNDPLNDDVQPSPFGGQNSVVVVSDDSSRGASDSAQ
jgi:1,4-alpha-glucan branching enzyme